MSGTKSTIKGNKPIFAQDTIRHYSINKFYEPIPLEFLSAAATSPQVLVMVDGIEAICPNLNCDYTYSAPNAKITSQKLTGNVIEVEGTDLPVTADVEVSISGTACSINEKTATKVTCTLSSTPTAGDWHVEVRDSEGRANPGSVAKISIPLIVKTVSPKADINFYGGTVLTLTGTGFPLETKKAKVKLDDQTNCKVLTATANEITCKL